jgi:acyl-CoA reductase-like NAD-dependent aldehyde dehydrogenase
VAGSIFFNQGESCNAPSRVLVHASVADRFVEIVAAEAPNYPPADPLDPATVMGALVDGRQMKTVLGYIEAGRNEGARSWPVAGRPGPRPAAAMSSPRCSTACSTA